EQAGLRLLDAELVDHPDAVLARELRQNRAEPRAVHLAVHLVREVLVGRIRKNLAAAAPQRARGHAGAGTARAFLPPWFLGGVIDRAAILLRARAKTRVCLERHHDLVHQRLVEVAREQRVGRVEGAGSAFVVHHFEFHGAAWLSFSSPQAAVPSWRAWQAAARLSGPQLSGPQPWGPGPL